MKNLQAPTNKQTFFRFARMKSVLIFILFVIGIKTNCQDFKGTWTGKLWSLDKNNADTCKLVLDVGSNFPADSSAQLKCFLNDSIYTTIKVICSFNKRQAVLFIKEKELVEKKMPDRWIVYFLNYRLSFKEAATQELRGKAKCISTSNSAIECTSETYEVLLKKKD